VVPEPSPGCKDSPERTQVCRHRDRWRLSEHQKILDLGTQQEWQRFCAPVQFSWQQAGVASFVLCQHSKLNFMRMTGVFFWMHELLRSFQIATQNLRPSADLLQGGAIVCPRGPPRLPLVPAIHAQTGGRTETSITFHLPSMPDAALYQMALQVIRR
jgi:hypothetical protein